MPSLSAVRVRDAKPREKPYELFDERGLYLLIKPSADQYQGRLWRFRYRVNQQVRDVSREISFGTNPSWDLQLLILQYWS